MEFSITEILTSIISVIISFILQLKHRLRKREPVESDDDCLSLFYHKHVGPDGSGIPHSRTCTASEVASLRAARSACGRLPSELYRRAVESLPIV
jgi:hypothetical protein